MCVWTCVGFLLFCFSLYNTDLMLLCHIRELLQGLVPASLLGHSGQAANTLIVTFLSSSISSISTGLLQAATLPASASQGGARCCNGFTLLERHEKHNVYILQANKIGTSHSNKVGSVLSQCTDLILHPFFLCRCTEVAPRRNHHVWLARRAVSSKVLQHPTVCN